VFGLGGVVRDVFSNSCTDLASNTGDFTVPAACQ
jgi:hypothetical protein